jgi:hypothetical protein
MKVTEEMVNKAALAYEGFTESQEFITDDGVFFTAMRAALEAVLGSYEREHSRWERFSKPEISVITAAMSTLDTNGAPTEKIEYAQRLANETRAVLGYDKSAP